VLEAPVAAAAELLIAAELPVESPVAGLSTPGLVRVSPDGHGVGTAVEEPLDAVGQLAGVECLGGDVVGGVGLFVVVGDDAAHELGGLAAAAAAAHVHTGVG
jgi:hypothetical protein